jgi:type III pantothenate kinase
MSLLLIDAGNSRLKWAGADGDGLHDGGAAGHGGDPASAVGKIVAPKPQAIWIANVTGPALGHALAAALRTRFGVTPRFAAVQAEHNGLRVAYAEPQRLGVDRWLGLLAAWSETRGAACVASAGTALTFDAVDAAGQHLGGVIAPGLVAMQQAVLGATRFAAAGPAQDYTPGLGADTDACVRQGALHAGTGLVERLAARHGAHARRYLSGGDAAHLLPGLTGIWQLRPNLVMEGLLAFALSS